MTAFAHFLRNQSGAVTVDWVVLTAATVGLGLASLAAVRIGVNDLGADVETSLSNARVAAMTGMNGLALRLDLASFLGSSPVTVSTNRGAGRDSDFRVENVIGPDGVEETVLVWRDSIADYAWFDLPENFTGDLSHMMGARVGYDAWVMARDAAQNPNTSSPVFAIAGANGMTLTARSATPPNTESWTSIGANLQEGVWRVEGTNRNATEAEIRAVLRQVDTVQVRAEYFSMYDQVAIKNMSIE
jgi:hypothetical protein